MSNKYYIPIEFHHYKNKILGISTYKYVLFSDSKEVEFASIKFIDIKGYIIGVHSPVKFKSNYNKAAEQVKNGTSKVVAEVKSIAENVSAIAEDVGAEIKSDAAFITKETAKQASSFFGKVKSIFNRTI